MEIIEWPVAVAIGAGTEFVRRALWTKQPARETGDRGQAGETAGVSPRATAAESGRASETAGQSRRGGHDVEPWPEYDQQNVEEINRRLADAEPTVARAVGDYERRHKNRTTILTEADRKAPS